MKDIKTQLHSFKSDENQIIFIRADLTRENVVELRKAIDDVFSDKHKIGLVVLPKDSQIDFLRNDPKED